MRKPKFLRNIKLSQSTNASPLPIVTTHIMDQQKESSPDTLVSVRLINGHEREQISYPVELLQKNSELMKMMNEPRCCKDGTIEIHDVTKSDLERFFNFLETDFIEFVDFKNTLSIMNLAYRFQCLNLLLKCVQALDESLNCNSVVHVYKYLSLYHNLLEKYLADFQRINESTKAKDYLIAGLRQEEIYSIALLYNTLLFIDANADEILLLPQMSELSFNEIKILANRNTLQISSEVLLFDCLALWSVAECKRKHFRASVENRRRILGSLCYAPRYLHMSMEEFDRAMLCLPMLIYEEKQLVRAELNNAKTYIELAAQYQVLLQKFRKSRDKNSHGKPLPLSERSIKVQFEQQDTGRKSKTCKVRKSIRYWLERFGRWLMRLW